MYTFIYLPNTILARPPKSPEVIGGIVICGYEFIIIALRGVL